MARSGGKSTVEVGTAGVEIIAVCNMHGKKLAAVPVDSICVGYIFITRTIRSVPPSTENTEQ